MIDEGRNSFEIEANKRRRLGYNVLDFLGIGEKIIEEVKKEAKKKVKEENYILHHLKP